MEKKDNKTTTSEKTLELLRKNTAPTENLTDKNKLDNPTDNPEMDTVTITEEELANLTATEICNLPDEILADLSEDQVDELGTRLINDPPLDLHKPAYDAIEEQLELENIPKFYPRYQQYKKAFNQYVEVPSQKWNGLTPLAKKRRTEAWDREVTKYHAWQKRDNKVKGFSGAADTTKA